MYFHASVYSRFLSRNQWQIKTNPMESLLRLFRCSWKGHVAVLVHLTAARLAKSSVLQAALTGINEKNRFSITFEETLNVTFLRIREWIGARRAEELINGSTFV